MSEIHLWVYRDFENRQAGEPDDGRLAWAAHRAREEALREVLSDPAFSTTWSDEVTDRARPHELVEVVVEVLKNPTAQAVLMGAAAYVGKVIAAQVDKMLGDGVAHIFNGIIGHLRKKKVGDFWITLPDGGRIAVDPNSQVHISLKDGKAISFILDSPPSA